MYQACGATQQECHGEHRQSWGHQRSGVLETQGPQSASPTYPSTTVSLTHTRTHTHTQSCTLPRLTSHDTNDQPNYGYTHTIQSYSHAKRLHSQTPNLTVLNTKSHEFVFTVEEFQCTHIQDHCTPIISTAHQTSTGSPHDHVCMLFAG